MVDFLSFPPFSLCVSVLSLLSERDGEREGGRREIERRGLEIAQ